MARLLPTLLALALLMLPDGLIGTASADDGAALFREQVAPVLERHCVNCHSGSTPKGGLNLSTRALTLTGGESGPAIVVDKPEESALIEHISGEKPSMPKDAPPLSADQVASISRWIAAGAPWPDGTVLTDKKTIDGNWWSLLPLMPVNVPPLTDPWIRTPVDAFILAKLREQQLSPSPEADRRTLIRRLTYDLHGLPPTPAEIEAFVNDTRDDAYPVVVDRLLASPRYGERWGRYWLDVVHFGESHGYDKDKPRPNAWPYRDYVIRSLNADKPYDRFVAEQVAGDFLYPGDPQALVATGFIAAGPWDFVGHVELREGTVDKDIARSNDRDDMLANTMSSFVSLTVHCARCHNHKFDPIRQQDYYALQAVFAGVERADRPYDPDTNVAATRARLTAELERQANLLMAESQKIAAITSPEIARLDEQLSAWRKELDDLPEVKESQTLGYHSAIEPKRDVVKWVQVDLGQAESIERIDLVPAHEKYGGHPGPGFGFPSRFKVEVSDDANFATSLLVADHTQNNFAHPGNRVQRIETPGIRGRYVRVTATRLWERTNDWIFALAELIVLSGDRNLAAGKTVTALDSIEAAPAWAKSNLVDGYSSRSKLSADDPARLSRRQQLNRQIEQGDQERMRLVRQKLEPATAALLPQLDASIEKLNAELEALPEPHSFYAAPALKDPPREIHLLARGDVRSPQEPVAPGAVGSVQGPQFKLTDDTNEASRRAALAGWLTDPRNGLLRRSIVNRVWHYHFGQGLVDTPNDFGRLGSLPTHPELLDWLAGRFSANGHSLKELHRLMVSSAVYRQQSLTRPEGEKTDTGNRYLWRMQRTRLDAECIRDAMLAVSGKLDLTMGGPSVQQFFFKDDHSPVYDYTRFDVDDSRSFRRSIYRFLVRSVPDPFMECLDCADPSIMTPKRNTTLTSIQALALLNNPLAVRQAEHFAARLKTLSDNTPGQIEAAYQLALGRSARPEEIEALSAYIATHGLANACRVIFNSNEFLFID